MPPAAASRAARASRRCSTRGRPTAMPATSPPGLTMNVAGRPVTRHAPAVLTSGSSRIGNVSREVRDVGLEQRARRAAVHRDPERRPARAPGIRRQSALERRHLGRCRACTRSPRSSGPRACRRSPRATACASPGNVRSRKRGAALALLELGDARLLEGVEGGGRASPWWPPSSPGRRDGKRPEHARRRARRPAPTRSRTPRRVPPSERARRPASHGSPGCRGAPPRAPRTRSTPFSMM